MIKPPAPEPAAAARSLFGEILDWMLAPLLLLWPVSIAVTYLLAKSIASVPFDHALESRTSVLARQLSAERGVVVLHLPDATRDWLLDDPDDATLFQVRAPDGRILAGSATLPAPVHKEAPQPGIVRFRDDNLGGHELRIATLYALIPDAGDTPALVQVAETLSKRSALANDIIKGVILPQFVILPLVIMLVWFGLSRGLAPLHALQARIRERRPDDSSPLSSVEAPIEIAPLVASFNDLLVRLDENTVIQKRFIAQAAHQMKTPLAGLRMQAELALRQPVPPEVQRSLEQIAASSRQAARLVTQLLSLARAENSTRGRGSEAVDIDALARSVVHDWASLALEKRMDLGYERFEAPERAATTVMTRAEAEAAEAEASAASGTAQGAADALSETDDIGAGIGMDADTVILNDARRENNATAQAGDIWIAHGQPVMLREMLANLIDNAIRYTPAGGRITVRVVPQPERGVAIEVEDTGPGIPEAERARVLERFYRILGREGDGSGLGLAIVNEIVAMHGGTLTVTDHVYHETPRQAGTLIRVTLPYEHRASPVERTS
jgi:two-component system sensor histidine kinase TctE